MLLALALLFVTLTENAQAFYNPTTGRWLSRDPIEEKGGTGIYAFVVNNPIKFYDKLGLFPGFGEPDMQHSQPWDWGAVGNAMCPIRCSGVAYNPFTSCCRDGQILSRAKQVTGVKWCSGGIHRWIEYPGGSAGYYPAGTTTGDVVCGSGQVVNPEPHISDEDKTCSEIKLSPCQYDLDKFKGCVSRKSAARIGDSVYSVFGFNCGNWVAMVVRTCKEEAKK